jgi:predicted MFS family arabinose efflux permease
LAILLYAGHNVIASGAALVAGWLIDVSTPRLLLIIAAASYTIAYLMFGAASHSGVVVAVSFLLAGFGIGCGETAEGAMIANRLPEAIRAQGLGMLGLVQAAGDIGATVVGGLLWSAYGAQPAFAYAAAWMLVSFVLGGVIRGTQS